MGPHSHSGLCKSGQPVPLVQAWWGMSTGIPGPSSRRKGGKKALFISTIQEPLGHACSVCFKVPNRGLSLVRGCPSECLGPGFKPGPTGT